MRKKKEKPATKKEGKVVDVDKKNVAETESESYINRLSIQRKILQRLVESESGETGQGKNN